MADRMLRLDATMIRLSTKAHVRVFEVTCAYADIEKHIVRCLEGFPTAVVVIEENWRKVLLRGGKSFAERRFTTLPLLDWRKRTPFNDESVLTVEYKLSL